MSHIYNNNLGFLDVDLISRLFYAKFCRVPLARNCWHKACKPQHSPTCITRQIDRHWHYPCTMIKAKNMTYSQDWQVLPTSGLNHGLNWVGQNQ